MAKQKRDSARRQPIEQPLEDKPGDIEALGRFIRDNPLLSAGVVVFVLLCVLAGLLYRVNVSVQARESATQYAKALDAEEPEERVDALQPVTGQGGQMGELALYRMGEAAFSAGDYEKAKSAFDELLAQHPGSAHAPDALEGLGYIAEEQGDLDAAVEKYEEVASRWPASFQALRQKYNIGRVREKQEQFENAIRAYRDQVAEFPESHVARKAQSALDRLRLSHAEAYEKVTEQDIELDALESPAAPEPGDETGVIDVPALDEAVAPGATEGAAAEQGEPEVPSVPQPESAPAQPE